MITFILFGMAGGIVAGWLFTEWAEDRELDRARGKIAHLEDTIEGLDEELAYANALLTRYQEEGCLVLLGEELGAIEI